MQLQLRLKVKVNKSVMESFYFKRYHITIDESSYASAKASSNASVQPLSISIEEYTENDSGGYVATSIKNLYSNILAKRFLISTQIVKENQDICVVVDDVYCLLIDLDGIEYIYIDHNNLYHFVPEAHITKFYADQYGPFAVDNFGNCYLFRKKVMISDLPTRHQMNPYDYYRSHRVIAPDANKQDLPLIKNSDDIQSFYFGNVKNVKGVRYVPFPNEEYDMITKLNQGAFFYVDSKGNHVYVDKMKFGIIMHNFEKVSNMKAMRIVPSSLKSELPMSMPMPIAMERTSTVQPIAVYGDVHDLDEPVVSVPKKGKGFMNRCRQFIRAKI